MVGHDWTKYDFGTFEHQPQHCERIRERIRNTLRKVRQTWHRMRPDKVMAQLYAASAGDVELAKTIRAVIDTKDKLGVEGMTTFLTLELSEPKVFAPDETPACEVA